ncbi:MAG TPA: BON domain-containing protein [Blastocatellia bacterium]|nr:BON domain-containing protein [Blastocatellia bacterium]
MKSRITALLTALVLMGSAAIAAPAAPRDQALDQVRLTERIRKELVTLPWYGVFDNLAFRLDGDTVTLYGQVVRPSTRADAERRVDRLPGVEKVINRIEVLPLSPFDDELRMRTLRAVFNTGGLYRYGMGANPSIHIIVNRGNITLEGVVASRMDAQLAWMAASGVPGAFSVTNNLRIEQAS